MNRFLARVSAQQIANIGYVTPKIQNLPEGAESERPSDAKSDEEPLSEQEIRYYLEKIDEKDKKMSEPNSITFDCIQNFVGWFETRRGEFNDKQRAALESLVKCKEQINLGCSCKIHVRQQMGDQYYKNFFINNKGTDLIAAIKLVAKVELVIFKIGIEEFLRS